MQQLQDPMPLLLLVPLLAASAASDLDAWCPDHIKRFDARQLGAVANGVTNDRAAIQSAIDQASAQRQTGARPVPCCRQASTPRADCC